MESHILYYNNEKIVVEILRKSIKNFNLHIKSNRAVYISVPHRAKFDIIVKYLESKVLWIYKGLKRLEVRDKIYRIDDLEDINSKITYLGSTYQIIQEKSNKESIEFVGDNLVLSSKKTLDLFDIRKKLNTAYRNDIKKITDLLCQNLYSHYPKLFPQAEINIRKMKGRWGSCNASKKKVTFNSELIYTPLSCIEYVVTHEFVHFLHANHSPRFYLALEKLMPDYKERRKKLKSIAIL